MGAAGCRVRSWSTAAAHRWGRARRSGMRRLSRPPPPKHPQKPDRDCNATYSLRRLPCRFRVPTSLPRPRSRTPSLPRQTPPRIQPAATSTRRVFPEASTKDARCAPVGSPNQTLVEWRRRLLHACRPPTGRADRQHRNRSRRRAALVAVWPDSEDAGRNAAVRGRACRQSQTDIETVVEPLLLVDVRPVYSASTTWRSLSKSGLRSKRFVFPVRTIRFMYLFSSSAWRIAGPS